MVNFIIGSLIFTYAGWTIVRLFRRSQQGQCSSCHKSECPAARDCKK